MSNHLLQFITGLSAFGLGVYWAVRKGAKEEREKEQEVQEDDFLPLQACEVKEDDSYQSDLKRYGTVQGVIDVSSLEKDEKRRKKTLRKLQRRSEQITISTPKKTVQKIRKGTSYGAFYNWLQSHFSKTQLSITNLSNTERVIRLWGMNNGTSISAPLKEDVEDHKIIETIDYQELSSEKGGSPVHPQGVIYNPVNGLTYIANQLSNNVTVIDENAKVRAIVELEPGLIPGFNSPVAMAVNTNDKSPFYGTVYVAGSIANTISRIDLSLKVTGFVKVTARPVELCYDGFTDKLYVASLFLDQVMVIDAKTNKVTTTLFGGVFPRSIAVNPENGAVYILSYREGMIWMYDKNGGLLMPIPGVGQNPESITYNPLNKQLYVSSSKTDEVYPIDTKTNFPLAPIKTGKHPYKSVFNPGNNYLYVSCKGDNSITVLDQNNRKVSSIQIGPINNGFALDTKTGRFILSDTLNNKIYLVGYANQTSQVIIREAYKKKAMDFMYNPAIVEHVKWVFSDDDRFSVLELSRKTPTGEKTVKAISNTATKSPQHMQNVSEMMALKGSLIEGKTDWVFKIAPQQTITLIVHYKQLLRKPPTVNDPGVFLSR